MNICIIGNSHAAALKKAWVEISHKYEHINCTFFVHKANELDNLVVENQQLSPITKELESALIKHSGGKKSINPNEFDVIILYGLYLVFNEKLEDIHHNKIFYSSRVFNTSLLDLVKNSLSFKLFSQLRKINKSVHILIGHCPLKIATNIHYIGTSRDYLNIISYINDNIFYLSNSELIPQPTKTIVNQYETAPEYSIKAQLIKEKREVPEKLQFDRMHANTEYSIHWLTSVISKLKNREQK